MSWSRTVAASCVVIGGQAGRDSAVSLVTMRVPSRTVGDEVRVVSSASDTWAGESSHFFRCAFCTGEGATTPAGGGRDEEEDEDEEEDLGRCEEEEEEDTVAPDEDEEWAFAEELDSNPLDVNEVAVLSVETCWFQREGRV